MEQRLCPRAVKPGDPKQWNSGSALVCSLLAYITEHQGLELNQYPSSQIEGGLLDAS
jgi:hypothetical protein